MPPILLNIDFGRAASRSAVQLLSGFAKRTTRPRVPSDRSSAQGSGAPLRHRAREESPEDTVRMGYPRSRGCRGAVMARTLTTVVGSSAMVLCAVSTWASDGDGDNGIEKKPAGDRAPCEPGLPFRPMRTPDAQGLGTGRLEGRRRQCPWPPSRPGGQLHRLLRARRQRQRTTGQAGRRGVGEARRDLLEVPDPERRGKQGGEPGEGPVRPRQERRPGALGAVRQHVPAVRPEGLSAQLQPPARARRAEGRHCDRRRHEGRTAHRPGRARQRALGVRRDAGQALSDQAH